MNLNRTIHSWQAYDPDDVSQQYWLLQRYYNVNIVS